MQLRGESHFKEAIGLVKDEVFDAPERELHLGEDMLQPSGRCDEHVRIRSQ